MSWYVKYFGNKLSQEHGILLTYVFGLDNINIDALLFTYLDLDSGCHSRDDIQGGK